MMTGLLFSSNAGVFYAFSNSDGVGKSIVVLLIIFSIYTWSTMLCKFLDIYGAKKLSERFFAKFTERSRVTDPVLRREAVNDPAPLARIYCEGLDKLLKFYDDNNATINALGSVECEKKLTGEQISAVEAVLERTVSQQIFELETGIGSLATMVSVSPFFGLFGTVWGVMMAFCGIAAAGRSDFQALAPGIAGALLTTVAGLLVAIPSLVGYNLLTSNIRKLTVYMDNFTEEFTVKLKLEQASSRRNGEED